MIGIIGGGPSGLALSLFLKEEHEVLEQSEQTGGHASSFSEQGFTFDYGPHILFSRDQDILDFIVASLGDNVNRCRRNNKIAFRDRLIKYPFENDLHALPLDDNYACIHDFIFNPYKTRYADPRNMREWFLKTFGEGLCSRYLFPYNEKVWNIPIEQLSMDLASRIPNPSPEDMLKSSLGYSTEGYLHQLYYYYPKTGGYQAICRAWEKATPLTRQFRVHKVEKTAEQRLRLFDSMGRSRDYRHVISTMPVHELIHCLGWEVPQAIHEAVEQLIVNPMIIISFGIRGEDSNQYTAIYFPEAEFWVNRISYPCTFSRQNGPEGCWSIQAEITCAKDAELWNCSDEEIVQHTRQGLQQRQLLPADEHILFARVDRQQRSYVVYNTGYEERANRVRQWFQSQGISLLGRFSRFEYINIDMAVDRALLLATELNGDLQQKQLYLAHALRKLN